DPQVDFAYWHRPTFRAEKPALNQFRFGECIEHQLSRGVEITLDLDLEIGWCGDFETLGVEQHYGSFCIIGEKVSDASFSWVLTLPTQCRAGQTTPPRIGDTGRATRCPPPVAWARAGLADVARRDLWK